MVWVGANDFDWPEEKVSGALQTAFVTVRSILLHVLQVPAEVCKAGVEAVFEDLFHVFHVCNDLLSQVLGCNSKPRGKRKRYEQAVSVSQCLAAIQAKRLQSETDCFLGTLERRFGLCALLQGRFHSQSQHCLFPALRTVPAIHDA